MHITMRLSAFFRHSCQRLHYMSKRFPLKYFLFLVCIYVTYDLMFNLKILIYSKNFNTFSYPLETDLYRKIEHHERRTQQNANMKVINPLPFELLLGSNVIKEANQTIEILYIVKTQHSNYDNRKYIRKTWGNPECGKKYGIKTVTKFIFGTANPSKGNVNELEDSLDKENQKYHDIVQYNFVDDYYNNTYKLMCALTYAKDYFSTAKYLLIQDDDYFVHPPNLFSHVRSIHPQRYPFYAGGGVWYKARPNREMTSKWSIGFDEYPFEYYPDYPAGGSIILSMPLVKQLSVAFLYLKFMAFDDVLLGIALFKLGIAPHNINGICNSKEYCPINDVSRVISSHGYRDPQNLMKIWNLYRLDNFCNMQRH